jgi:hypothetical protein
MNSTNPERKELNELKKPKKLFSLYAICNARIGVVQD